MLLPPIALVSFFEDALGAVGEIGFAIKLMALVYILFWLYMTFQDNQMIFGFVSLIAAYFIIFHSPVILTLAIVVLLMTSGMFIQQTLMFGLFPLMGKGSMGENIDHEAHMEGERAQRLQMQMQKGAQLGEEDRQFMAQYQARQQMAEAQMQQFASAYSSQVGMRRMR
ncbi:hypothetical protein HY995_03715 [Candidatus Micrarchaeota archaeon]|nr:hypothetical protein [Candidatus Micrarchaeota archaeon]